MRKLFSVLAGLCLLAACAQTATPYSIAFSVRPTAAGAEILADVQGGPARAWIGFGVGPGADPRLTDRIEGVAAFAADGSPLEVVPSGTAGYRIDTGGEPWQFVYRLRLETAANDHDFYRASTRAPDYTILVGSDAWARFYTSPTPLTRSPEARPPGPVSSAVASFQLPRGAREWKVVSTAWEEAPNTFAMRQHPVGSVFALGPFVTSALPDAAGMRVARHVDWDILPQAVEPMLGQLLTSHRNIIGADNEGRALVLLSPLPAPLTVQGGLRTAGMVRDQTLIVYAARAPEVPADHAGIGEAMAVFLGHELFHLWVPTGVQVTRELSWLSEGWAMHMGRRAALATGWLDESGGSRRLRTSYRRYLDIGGYRAGSLPAASLGQESQRNLLYLRGELVFRLLEREWQEAHPHEPFEQALWQALSSAYDGIEPLDARTVRTVLAELVDPATVRRYVEGQAPLTPATLGLAGQ